MDKVLAIVLAGGEGSRLYPLTKTRAKPAVPFGGKYRIIDFTLSNCLHSRIRRILVLTQYKSHSLHKHLRDAWSIYSPEIGEYITDVPAQMQMGEHWYSGTADAVYQNIALISRCDAEEVLILSGDHIYRMDYAAMIEQHRRNKAKATIACMQVPCREARELGVVECNAQGMIVRFEEKPEHPATMPGSPNTCLASMGIYVFNKQALLERLQADQNNRDSQHDFAHDILPCWIREEQVYPYMFGLPAGRVTPDNYWRDVGTIDAYYRANMDLLRPVPPLNLYQQDWPIRSYHQPVPPCRTGPAEDGRHEQLENVIMGSGSIVTGARVRHSILFYLVSVAPGADIDSCILFDQVHIGRDVLLRRCIIDKHVRIPDGICIGLNPAEDSKRFHVTADGITVIPKEYRF